jgi:hypothetical protein
LVLVLLAGENSRILDPNTMSPPIWV